MKKIIIDADPGIDDSIAIMLAAKLKEYKILGISLVSGNVHIEKGRKNILRLSKFLNRDFKIYMGSEAPLIKDFINAEDTHGEDGLGETYLDFDEKEVDGDAIDFLIQEARKGNLTIFALGPLTNIARALKRDRDAFLDTRIIIMGGNFKSHGNMSPVAEFNFYVDPDAADYVIKNAPRKVEIMPLDVTRKFVLTPSILSYMKRLNPTMGNFIEKITDFYMDFHWEYEKIIGSVINDPLTILLERKPEFFRGRSFNAECITDGPARGMLMVDEMDFMKREKNIILYEDLDVYEVWKYFLEEITKSEVDEKVLGDIL
ncbi:nucleoside hydrolase [Peptoniphilus gorbachii]|uniref:Purine nucleosidase n=1 Tax=Peptoniphilus gorbachii TaxID=411567 RepID=A0ABS2MI82_9FIRM|nr:nucleoside hydrolase [Peptoniphilus gorbachii]MBM7549730.1 purine nucleosidase [Peptoniphilus gorbachii]MDU1582568.1 nucleoside hydrolase [Peptoniphilus harei]MDU1664396.1 nucleoside hydrolase [Peptoniphilus harei]